MTKAKLMTLLVLLKMYRAALTWSFGGIEGQDKFRQRCDDVIRDVRYALRNGGFYNHPEFQAE
jgi:hypothetical protein